MIKSDKCMYEGDWHLGLMHGTGIYWDNKFMFDGQVVNGKIMQGVCYGNPKLHSSIGQQNLIKDFAQELDVYCLDGTRSVGNWKNKAPFGKTLMVTPRGHTTMQMRDGKNFTIIGELRKGEREFHPMCFMSAKVGVVLLSKISENSMKMIQKFLNANGFTSAFSNFKMFAQVRGETAKLGVDLNTKRLVDVQNLRADQDIKDIDFMHNFRHPNMVPIFSSFQNENGQLSFTMPPDFEGNLKAEIIQNVRENT